MKTRSIFYAALGVLAAQTISLRANTILFEAILTGDQEVPPTGSPGIGFGTVLLDDVAHIITVNESWADLLAAATVSHIHSPASPGVNAVVVFPLSGVPAATAGSIPTQVFSITDEQIALLEAGLDYLNVHSSQFPGGEIRGQLVRTVPDAGATWAGFLTLGGVLMAGSMRGRVGGRS